MRNLLSSPARSLPRRLRANRARRMSLERLEGRELLTAVGVPDGLVSWWTADNTAADLNGLNNASLYNGTTFAAGKVGRAFSFDGVDDRAQVTDADSLKFTGSLSIEGWIRVDKLTAGVVFFRGDDRGGLDPYNLSFDSGGQLQFEVTNALSASTVIKASVPLGQFVHVAATLDDATGAMSLYVNGSLASQCVTTVRPFRDLDPSSNPSIGIGNHGGYPTTPHNFPFDGLIDELSVYSRALTPTEVNGIYSAGTAGKIKTANYFAADFPSVEEGAAGTTTPITFTIQRVGSLAGQAVVNWATADNTATAGSDYVAASGQVVFQDGQSEATVQVTVNGDSAVEPNETFWLVLSTPTTGYAAGGGLATILNDDTAVSVGDVSLIEGDPSYRYMDDFVPPDAYGLAAARDIRVGPDGNLYVASHDTDVVKVFEAGTGRFLRDLGTPGGELDGPWGMTFGPDGMLYVGGRYSRNIIRFDPTTGSSSVFVAAAASGGLGAPKGLAFGPDGNLYASSRVESAPTTTDTVKRYDRLTGTYLGDFVTAGRNGLDGISGIAFGPDANLYVLGANSNNVLKYNGQSGSYLSTFIPAGSAGLSSPSALNFHTDGLLYVCSGNSRQILRYNATTGAFVDVFASGPSTFDVAFAASGDAYVSVGVGALQSGSAVLLYAPAGSYAAFTISLAQPVGSLVSVDYATGDGSALAGSDYLATTGTVVFAPGQTSRIVLVKVLNDALPEPTETFTLNLSDPVGASITDGQGVSTIIDDDATKFYVINDASTDRTYEYGAFGASVESYAINSGNTAPRGAASTAAGDKVWVADANKKVYVYGTGGALLGSWSAGGLPSNAAVEGITVYGNDVWIVDGKSDKVFKYAGAASLVSGSKNASGSFSLNTSQNNPNVDAKDIVTDGAAFWVVDDNASGKVAKIPKVFKYSMSGTLIDTWSIGAGVTSPTGITLDPTGGDTIWVLDGGTRRVYQFDNARSGSPSLTTSFALAAGNTNPQGIADPPAGAPIPVAGRSDPQGIADPPAGAPIPVGSTSTRSMAPARAVPRRLGLAAPSPSPIAVPSGPLSALDQALDGLGTGSSSEPGTGGIVADLLHARRRRAN